MSAQPPRPPDDPWPTREEVVVDDPLPGDTAERPAVVPPPESPTGGSGRGSSWAWPRWRSRQRRSRRMVLTRDDDSDGSTTAARTVTVRTSTVAAGVAVPRVIGLNEKNALVRIAEVGLRPKEVYRPTKKPTNVVVSQTPAEGRTLKKARRLRSSSTAARHASPFWTSPR